ncbi:DUF4190 domain-containing protein [Streptomyces sp. HMX112]|uniref:DUF4190 domain-containing protein n=1 Tax=Streptomyces sp. HMX112 TaxID=3390850 RepID=UPI003A802C62
MSYSSHPQTPNGYAQTHPDSPVKRSNGLAIAALVLGVAAILLFWTVFGGMVLGLLALVLGIIGARKARGGRAPYRGMSIAGAVLGALGLIASTVIVVIGASILNSDEYKSFDECVRQAGTQSERDACSAEFNREVND